MKTVLLAMLWIIALCGCTPSMGPRSIEANRPAYNQAIQQTNDQELLLNLVRSRYRDNLYFMNVERVAATLEFNQAIGASGSLTNTDNNFVIPPTTPGSTISGLATRTLSMAPSIALNEKPTVFYAPLEGEKFVRQMMTPMNPDILLLLVKSGWSLDRVFSIGVQEVNGLKNAPTASGPTPSREPEFRTFREAVKLLRVLQREQLLDLGRGANGDGLEFRFAPAAAQRDETIRLKDLLKLDPELNSYRILVGSVVSRTDSIALTTRPLISAINYLSQGVEVPVADFEAGYVRRTERANGQPFDWQEMLEGVFRVQVSPTPPKNSSVFVPYNGSYFYIARNDLDSKSTFVLLTQLIALHSTPANSNLPVSFSFGK